MSTPRFRPPVTDYPSAIPMAEVTRLLTQDLGAYVCVIGHDLRFMFVNEPFATALGFTPAQMVGMTMLDAYGESHVEVLTGYLQRALAGESLDYERFGPMRVGPMAQRSGLWRTVTLRPWRDADKRIIGVIGVAVTVHELKNSAEELRVANERLSSHMDNSPLLVIDLDASLNITRCSARSQQVFGQAPAELLGRNVLAQLSGLRGDALQSCFERLQRGDEFRNHVASTHQRADGSLLHCEWFNSALTDADGHVTSIMSLVEDVTARVAAESQLRWMATHDQLTGLRNRAAMEERAALALARVRRSGATVTLIVVDLDGFKPVNDRLGHAAGDRVLIEVARRLTTCVRSTDTVARVGGDEFVILLEPDDCGEGVDTIVNRVFAALAPPIDVGNGSASVGASIGIAQHPPGPDSAADLLKCADAAMYEAKRDGKGRAKHAAATGA